MNILVIVILAVLLLNVLNGRKNGFLKTAFSLVSWIIVLIICNVLTPMVTQMLIEKTEIETTIQTVLDAEMDKMLANAMQEIGSAELPDGVVFELPEELEAALPEELKSLFVKDGLTLLGGSAEGAEVTFVDTVAIAERVVGMISLLIVLVFARVAIVIAYGILGIASKLPLIGPLDRVLGVVCGAAKGVIWSWIILTVVSMLALTGVNTEWAMYISQSEILMWLQNNNLILNLFV